jgi:hypothetical protein
MIDTVQSCNIVVNDIKLIFFVLELNLDDESKLLPSNFLFNFLKHINMFVKVYMTGTLIKGQLQISLLMRLCIQPRDNFTTIKFPPTLNIICS